MRARALVYVYARIPVTPFMSGWKVRSLRLTIVRYLCLRIGVDLTYFLGVPNYNSVETKGIAIQNTWNFLHNTIWNLSEIVRISVRRKIYALSVLEIVRFTPGK